MSSYNNELKNGLFWTAINKYSGFFVQLLITSVLARLITPDEFGVVAIAQVCIVFIGIFTEMGIGPAIIQNKNLSEKDLDSIFTYSVLVSLFMSIIFFLISPIIANYYDNYRLEKICRLLSLAIFFTATNVVPGALFFKNKEFKFIAVRNLSFQIISGAIAIVYAFCGGGCYALLITPILTGFLNLIVSLVKYPRKIDWAFNFNPLRQIMSFSAFQFLFTFCNFFSRNLDKLIIGKHLGMSQLGYYQKAYQLMLMPIDKVSEVFYPVLQPLLSEYQDTKYIIAKKYNNIAKFISMLSFPLTVLLFFAAEEIIIIIFGNQWLDAVLPFKVLALSIPTQMLTSSSGALYQSANNTKALFSVGMFSTIITVVGFMIASLVFKTITAVSCAWVICNITVFIVSYGYLYVRILKSSFIDLLSTMALPLINAVILVIILMLFSYLNVSNEIISLIFKSAITLIVTLLYLHISKQVNVINLLKTIVKKIRP